MWQVFLQPTPGRRAFAHRMRRRMRRVLRDARDRMGGNTLHGPCGACNGRRRGSGRRKWDRREWERCKWERRQQNGCHLGGRRFPAGGA